MEFGAGVEGGRDLAEDAGAQPLLRAGGHPVRRQRQGGGRHEAQHGGGNHGGQRGRQEQRDAGDGGGGDSHGGEWRQDHPGQQLPDRVDVVHDGAQDVAALQQTAQREGPPAQRLPEPAAEPGQGGKDGVVQQEALEVAQRRPADAEEAHTHDRGEQVQDGRLLAGADDQPAGEPGEGDGEECRQGADGAGRGELGSHGCEQTAEPGRR